MINHPFLQPSISSAHSEEDDSVSWLSIRQEEHTSFSNAPLRLAGRRVKLNYTASTPPPEPNLPRRKGRKSKRKGNRVNKPRVIRHINGVTEIAGSSRILECTQSLSHLFHHDHQIVRFPLHLIRPQTVEESPIPELEEVTTSPPRSPEVISENTFQAPADSPPFLELEMSESPHEARPIEADTETQPTHNLAPAPNTSEPALETPAPTTVTQTIQTQPNSIHMTFRVIKPVRTVLQTSAGEVSGLLVPPALIGRKKPQTREQRLQLNKEREKLRRQRKKQEQTVLEQSNQQRALETKQQVSSQIQRDINSSDIVQVLRERKQEGKLSVALTEENFEEFALFVLESSCVSRRCDFSFKGQEYEQLRRSIQTTLRSRIDRQRKATYINELKNAASSASQSTT
ncbi:hypothetical protein [Endozoicomonas arenosclerae]|uniref:hypothetical protein n=1 Tax=Endozoicomonas arenosclerae TaxID=1633495 RepID=UPI000785369E|nr:hypothetical protein [Endozoicomonas arenosclerae]